jgi:ankyrin repeat protein
VIPLPFGSPLASYEQQAADESRTERLSLDEARLGVARAYSFPDWPALCEWVSQVTGGDSPARRFELAVQAVIDGDTRSLERSLAAEPGLVRARSGITHHATLLHYVAANGVEAWRQRTPPNAVDIATLLLRAGAEPDALADMYGGRHTTMSMLVSSVHPAQAGVQVALVETLLDSGAAVDGHGDGRWTSPLMTALAFGYLDTARALVGRGARADTLPAAAGLGRLEHARRVLGEADPEARHQALALAAQHGHTPIVQLLLDAGEDPNRYNPEGNHAHATPLHQAALYGHLDTVRLLVERGARVDRRDTAHQGTPLDWAEYGRQAAVADYLRRRQVDVRS